MDISLSDLANGLASHPTAWLLALALGALAWLFKLYVGQQKEFITMTREQEAEHRETLKLIVPLASKLADSVEASERIVTAALKE